MHAPITKPKTESNAAARKRKFEKWLGADQRYKNILHRFDGGCDAGARVAAKIGTNKSYEWLIDRACPGPVDQPHPARLDLSKFRPQNHWSRWAHARKCSVDLRRNGKVRCQPDATWDTTVAMGREDAIATKIDEDLRIAGLDYPWQDRPPAPQKKNITTYRRGEAPFHRIDKPSPRETIRLLNLYRRTGNMLARNTLVAGYIDDAKRIARKTAGNVEDIEQDAAVALIEAVEK